MACVGAVRAYLERMLGAIGGMKVLLLDGATTAIVSVAESQTDILRHEVYDVAQLDARREMMRHMKAIVFVRPTAENIMHTDAYVIKLQWAVKPRPLASKASTLVILSTGIPCS